MPSIDKHLYFRVWNDKLDRDEQLGWKNRVQQNKQYKEKRFT